MVRECRLRSFDYGIVESFSADRVASRSDVLSHDILVFHRVCFSPQFQNLPASRLVPGLSPSLDCMTWIVRACRVSEIDLLKVECLTSPCETAMAFFHPCLNLDNGAALLERGLGQNLFFVLIQWSSRVYLILP